MLVVMSNSKARVRVNQEDRRKDREDRELLKAVKDSTAVLLDSVEVSEGGMVVSEAEALLSSTPKDKMMLGIITSSRGSSNSTGSDFFLVYFLQCSHLSHDFLSDPCNLVS